MDNTCCCKSNNRELNWKDEEIIYSHYENWTSLESRERETPRALAVG